MEVITAKSAGFCFGVKRAVDTVYEQIEKGGVIYTYGPIIHNELVVEDLASKGVKILNTPEELSEVKEGTVIIRSHGVSKEIYDLLEEKNISYVDATCPFVKRIHKIVEKESTDGKQIVIIGDAKHPEVEGIRSYAKDGAAVIETKEEALALTLKNDVPVCIVSQTTFNYAKFQELVAILEKKGYDYNVVNTICNATEERQTEAKEIAAKADAMIVIGGSHSSNSRKLYEICKKECEYTFFIQTLDDLKLEELPDTAGLVGITAGASTPNKIIEEVQKHVRIDF